MFSSCFGRILNSKREGAPVELQSDRVSLERMHYRCRDAESRRYQEEMNAEAQQRYLKTVSDEAYALIAGHAVRSEGFANEASTESELARRAMTLVEHAEAAFARNMQEARMAVAERDEAWRNEAQVYSAQVRNEHLELQRQANQSVSLERLMLREAQSQLDQERAQIERTQREIAETVRRHRDAESRAQLMREEAEAEVRRVTEEVSVDKQRYKDLERSVEQARTALQHERMKLDNERRYLQEEDSIAREHLAEASAAEREAFDNARVKAHREVQLREREFLQMQARMEERAKHLNEAELEFERARQGVTVPPSSWFGEGTGPQFGDS